jgi:hypothetical protein
LEKISKEIVLRELRRLSEAKVLEYGPDLYSFKPTELARLMTRFFLKFETAKLISGMLYPQASAGDRTATDPESGVTQRWIPLRTFRNSCRPSATPPSSAISCPGTSHSLLLALRRWLLADSNVIRCDRQGEKKILNAFNKVSKADREGSIEKAVRYPIKNGVKTVADKVSVLVQWTLQSHGPWRHASRNRRVALQFKRVHVCARDGCR